MYYTAFLEGLTADQEKQLTSILFTSLCKHLNVNAKKSKFTSTNQKILRQGKIFFYYNLNSQLLETEYPQQCKHDLTSSVSKVFGVNSQCVDFLKNLTFSSSETEAYMLSKNGLLFSKSTRIHKSNNRKTTVLYNGVVSTEFGMQQILVRNSGLVLGYLHTDFSSYHGLCTLLPTFKQYGVTALYLELPYHIFYSLFEKFNKNKGDISSILTELKPGINRLYKDKSIQEKLIASFQKLFIAAKKTGIKIYPCDVASLNFSAQAEQLQINKTHRLKVGDACMIRSIEKLQFNHKHPKFLVFVGLAHTKTMAEELGVPSCFIGDNKQSQKYQKYTELVDYIALTQSKTLYSSGSTPFLTSALNRFDQIADPKIKNIVDNWDKLAEKMSAVFSAIPSREIKKARETYIEYILEKSQDSHQQKISDICATTQGLVAEILRKAIYPKCTELVHPKNWLPLFHCQRPYGIRLAKDEPDAFTVTHLNELATNKATEIPVKLHYA